MGHDHGHVYGPKDTFYDDNGYIVHLEQTTPRFSWCDVCMTNGMVDMDMLAMSAESVTVVDSFHHCMTCNPEMFDDDTGEEQYV